MSKLIALSLLLVFSGCAIHDPNDDAGRISREFAKGEKLMVKCEKNKSKCPAYLEFKTQWETEMRHITTFEAALANHKARVARGYDV